MTARERELIQRWRKVHGEAWGFQAWLADETVYYHMKGTLGWACFCLTEACRDFGRAVISELQSFTTRWRK